MNNKNKFNFFVPAEIEKGIDKKGESVYKVKGICSDDNKDSDEEYLHPSGYDLTYFLSNGFINYNHRAKDDPSSIIGEPTMAKIIKGTQMYMEGVLYPSNKKAVAIYELAETLNKFGSTRKLGWSIEGQVIERDPMNPKIITKAKITGVAITPCPKNHNTFLDLVKGEYSEEFIPDDENEEKKEETLEDKDNKEKAMMANPALTHEDVEGKPKYLTKSEVYGKIFTFFNPRTIAESKKIYNFVCDINKANNNQEMAVEEKDLDRVFKLFDNINVLEKAMQTIISKGVSPQEIEEEEKNNPGIGVEETKPKKAVEPQASAPATPELPENDAPMADDTAQEDNEDEVAKAKKSSIKKGEEDDEEIDEVAKSMCSSADDDKDDLVEKLIRKGFSLKASESSASRVLADMAKQKNGNPNPEKLKETVDKLEKGFDSIRESIEIISEQNSSIGSTLLKGFVDLFNPKFETMGEIFADFQKAQSSNENQLSEIIKSFNALKEKSEKDSELIKSLSDEIATLSKKTEDLENYTPTRKSIINPQAIDRFAKAQSGTFEKSLNIRNDIEKKKVVDILFNEYQKNSSDKEIEKAIKQIELGGSPTEYAIDILNRTYKTQIIF